MSIGAWIGVVYVTMLPVAATAAIIWMRSEIRKGRHTLSGWPISPDTADPPTRMNVSAGDLGSLLLIFTFLWPLPLLFTLRGFAGWLGRRVFGKVYQARETETKLRE